MKKRARATGLKITGDDNRTSVRIEVSQSIVANLFTLDEPYRAIIDVADLDFHFPAGTQRQASPLIKAMRYGQFEMGRSRIVIDLAAPARMENAAFDAPTPGRPGLLRFDLTRVGASEFQAMRGPADAEAEPPAPPGKLRGASHDEQAAAPAQPTSQAPGQTPGQHSDQSTGQRHRPLVLLDPGHGGLDPGTVAASGVPEKSVTLAVAGLVRTILSQGGRYDVQMTRQTDVFISLDRRVKLSRQLGADLFVSIHADALAEKDLAAAVRGATVYVLADRASDEGARRLAEKENASDILAGIASLPASAEDQVRNILIDLVQRETANYSTTFSNLLLASLRGKVPLAKDPQRAAAFKVLKQPEVPAVLIELGYMSNSDDLARLGKAEGQRQLAASIASAIDSFFTKRDARLAR